MCCRFKQLKEQEARRKQQKEEEKRKAEEAAAKATEVHENGNDLVNEKPQAVTADKVPSPSGVLNGNPSNEGLERHQKATSASQTENDEASANFQFNERNEKSLERV